MKEWATSSFFKCISPVFRQPVSRCWSLGCATPGPAANIYILLLFSYMHQLYLNCLKRERISSSPLVLLASYLTIRANPHPLGSSYASACLDLFYT